MRQDSLHNALPADARWGHAYAFGTDGVKLHYVRQGEGDSVLLLHGWPGFWYDWRRVIPELAHHADVIAPDFRGFGHSDRPHVAPADGYTPQHHAQDMMALLDALHIDRVVIAAHDIGATIAQAVCRLIPDRIKALVLCNPPYPGIGTRRFDPNVQGEFWYQHFHNLPWADELIGYNRDTVRLYLRHFYQHWVGASDVISPQEFEAIVDEYAQPGAVRSSLAYYRARAGSRLKEAVQSPAAVSQILQPTTVLWGESDPVMRSDWSDRLDQYFTSVRLRLLPGVGHFVPVEAPEVIVETFLDVMTGKDGTL